MGFKQDLSLLMLWMVLGCWMAFKWSYRFTIGRMLMGVLCFILGTIKANHEIISELDTGMYSVMLRPVSKWTSRTVELGKVRAVWPEEFIMDKSWGRSTGFYHKENNRFKICSREVSSPSLQFKYLERVKGHLLPCKDESGRAFIIGVSTGDKSYMKPEDVSVFRKAGLAHILAVSGYHVGLVGFLPLLLVRSRYRSFRITAALGLVMIWGFIVACGFPVSAIRAGIMISLGFASFWMDRDALPFNALAVSAWVIAIFDSKAFLELGTWLSYAATAGILAQVYSSKLLLLRIPIAAQTATLPIIAHTFHTIPIWFLPLNVIASVLMTLIGILIATSLAIPSVVTFVADFITWLITYLHKASELVPLSYHIDNAYGFNAGAIAGYAWLFSPVIPSKLSQIISYTAIVVAIFELWIKFI